MTDATAPAPRERRIDVAGGIIQLGLKELDVQHERLKAANGAAVEPPHVIADAHFYMTAARTILRGVALAAKADVARAQVALRLADRVRRRVEAMRNVLEHPESYGLNTGHLQVSGEAPMDLEHFLVVEPEVDHGPRLVILGEGLLVQRATPVLQHVAIQALLGIQQELASMVNA